MNRRGMNTKELVRAVASILVPLPAMGNDSKFIDAVRMVHNQIWMYCYGRGWFLAGTMGKLKSDGGNLMIPFDMAETERQIREGFDFYDAPCGANCTKGVVL